MKGLRNLKRRIKLSVEKSKGIAANEKGQGMVEYVITITSISLIAMISMQGIGTWLDSILGTIAMAI